MKNLNKNIKCIKDFKIKLKDHQIKAVQYLMQPNIGGLLVSHPTGWGKSITAIAFAGCFLEKYKTKKVIIVGPVSITKMFSNYVEDLNLDSQRIEIYSYQRFANLYEEAKIECQGNALIIDEVHNLRNLGTFSYLDNTALTSTTERASKESGIRAKTVLECASGAIKRLLLTATPFVNELQDFIPIINFIYGGHLIYKKNQLKDIDDLDNYLKKRVYFIPPNFKNNKDFPDYKEEFVKILMPKNYEKDYCSLIQGKIVNKAGFKNPNSFYNAHRRAVNKIGRSQEYFSLKIKKAIKLVQPKKGLIYKSVIFSNWLEYGVEPIAKELEENNITYRIFTGSLSESKRNEIVRSFNDDEFDVLVLSASGKEGIDLKKVRRLIVMDPVWNFAGMEQIRGRAIRYQSHSSLPESERFVEIYYLLLVTNNRDCLSGDSVVYKFIEEKKKLQFKTDKKLKALTI